MIEPTALQQAIDATALGDGEGLARLVQLRHEAFRAPETPTGAKADIFDAAPNRLPVDVEAIRLADPTAEAVRASIAIYGCALLPSFLPEATVSDLRAGIDWAIRAFDQRKEVNDPEWFHPFDLPGENLPDYRRAFNRSAGSVWASDSPGMLARFIEAYAAAGVFTLLTDFFGERPVVSVNKCTLRRLDANAATGDWHQDGAFMGGQDIRSLNVWAALSDCGIDAPGLDLVPTRLPLLPVGTEGSNFDWSVSPAEISQHTDVPVIRPDFRAGDVMMFDHRFLHRTAGDPSMTRPRYAIESWFFPPSEYPENQVPIVV